MCLILSSVARELALCPWAHIGLQVVCLEVRASPHNPKDFPVASASPGPQSGAPGLKGSPQSQPRRRVGTTQGWELAEAPQKAKNRLAVAASASGLGPRATAVGSGLVWEATAGQATRTSIRFNPVQQGLGGLRMDPRPDSPAAIAGRGAGGGGAWTQPKANL